MIDITNYVPHYHERSIGPKVAFVGAIFGEGAWLGPEWVRCYGRNGDCPLVRSMAGVGGIKSLETGSHGTTAEPEKTRAQNWGRGVSRR